MGAPAGLKDDFESLLSCFREMDSVLFEDFFELWRSLKFGTIFQGLALAWRYFLPPYTFQIRTGILYLLVALKDWDEILKFQQDLINAKHFEAAYIFRKLRLDRAFHFTAMPKLLSYRMKTKIQRAEITEEFKDPNDCVMKLITSDVLEEMMNVHDHYQRMKHVISADKSNLEKSLNLIKDDFYFFYNIKNMALEHQQWHKDRKNPPLKLKVKDGEEKSERNLQQSQRCTVRSKLTSDSDSTPGQVQTKATRKRRNKEMLKPAENEVSSRARGDTQNIHKKEKSLSLNMPVVTEEDEENKSFSETEFTAPKRRTKQRTKTWCRVLNIELFDRKDLYRFISTNIFGYPMQRADLLEKTLMLGKIEGRKRRG
ncbi:hypothetical protein FD755_015435 [Muntiacus reevesi]|uniref:snRNA-activating protein complex subunit 1 n=1 Tax=Muntiacus reevesi TaxID=9886 RepID=A0A5N3XGA4_MUNRE|nr:hypothetical protein FD755_015435 [Muntiacus reevesi]